MVLTVCSPRKYWIFRKHSVQLFTVVNIHCVCVFITMNVFLIYYNIFVLFTLCKIITYISVHKVAESCDSNCTFKCSQFYNLLSQTCGLHLVHL
jgi:hypothetical protein